MIGRCNMKKFLLALVCVLFTIPFANAASADFSIHAQYGIDGKGRFNTTIPTTITITNDGDDFSGQLVTTFPESYQLQTAKVQPLSMKAGETKTVKMYLSSYPEQYYHNNRGQYVYIYEGDIESGKEVKDVKITNVKPTLYDFEAKVIATYSANTSFATLQKLRAQNELNVEVIEHKGDFILPDDARDLAMMTTILLDRQPLTELTEAQQRALLEWVEQGGQLIVDTPISGTLLAKHEPLTYSKTEESLTAQQLEKFAQGGTFFDGIAVKQATVNEVANAKVFSVDDIVLAATTSIGKGQLIQTTFSLGQAPFIEMDGYVQVIRKLLAMDEKSSYWMGQPKNEQVANDLAYINELFPSFSFSTWKIITALALYILIVGPILYVLLKKADKREHAWWIIPAISIIFSLAFFLFGAKDRLVSPQLQQAAVWKVTDDGAEKYFVQSVLANKQGDYTFALDEQTNAVAYNMGDTEFSNTQKTKWAYSEQTDDGSKLVLKNVNYWGVQSIVGHSKTTDQGRFDVQLNNENGQMQGSIRNDFPFDLTDVRIWVGMTFIEVGALAQGETATIDAPIETTILLPIAQENDDYYGHVTIDELEERRMKQLRRLAANVMQEEQQPVIVGSATNVSIGAELLKEARITSSTLVVQPFEATTEFVGEFTLQNDAFTRDLVTEAYGYKDQLDSSIKEWYLEDGSHELSFTLPLIVNNPSVSWTQATLEKPDDSMTLKIFNVKKDLYEELTAFPYTTTDVASYLDDNGDITLQINFASGEYGASVLLPQLTLKGEKSHD